jgi:hypothetical protein
MEAMYWRNLSYQMRDRLGEIASLLEHARDVRHAFGTYGDIATDSRAGDELRVAENDLGDKGAALVIHRSIQTWLVVAADLGGSVSTLRSADERRRVLRSL